MMQRHDDAAGAQFYALRNRRERGIQNRRVGIWTTALVKMSFGRPNSRESTAIGKLRAFQIKLVFVFAGTEVIGGEEE